MLETYSNKQASKITYAARERMRKQTAKEQLEEAKQSWSTEPEDVPDADDSSISRSHLM